MGRQAMSRGAGSAPVSGNGSMSRDRSLREHGAACDVVTDRRRAAPRKPVSMPGELSFGDRQCRVACHIVDMSATGARLKMDAFDRRLQQRVALYFEHEATNVECQIVWSDEQFVGVRFCSAFMRLAPER